MRFDDSLQTVLSAETASDAGSQAAWRQIVDLIGRGRVAADADAIARLRSLRGSVPDAVRAASARALALAQPPAALVALFGEDELAIAAPVLRTASLDGESWAAIVPRLTPAGRSVLRHRRDLPDGAARALAAFGPTDFVLPYDTPAAMEVPAGGQDLLPPAALSQPPIQTPVAAETPRFEIADLVARIDAFNRTREVPRAPGPAAPEHSSYDPVTMPPMGADGFCFEADATATIRWVAGVTATPLVGLNLARAEPQGCAQVDGGVAGACRRRASFCDARLNVGGDSDAAGSWRVSGTPAFDPVGGRFLGYRGRARRPRSDESAEPVAVRDRSESLRQLVHELRTPTNAIAGFAELIETELLGPVADPYRARAGAIRTQVNALVQAIDDLDTAARIDGGALELRPDAVSLRPLVLRLLADLQPLTALRGATVTLRPGEGDPFVVADDRALERLLSRLLAALIASAGDGERIGIALAAVGDTVTLAIDRPAAFDGAANDGGADDRGGEGGLLLGTAFALRLAGNLASELGGVLLVDAARLTLRLPMAVDRAMGQASTN